jgi:hypothetical protein
MNNRNKHHTMKSRNSLAGKGFNISAIGKGMAICFIRYGI